MTKQEFVEKWFSPMISNHNELYADIDSIQPESSVPVNNIIPNEVEDFIAKATAILEGLIPFDKKDSVIRLGNRLLDKYDINQEDKG